MKRDEMLARVESSRREWDELIDSVPSELVEAPLWENGWATKHVVAHVDFYQWWVTEFIRKRDWSTVDPSLDTWDTDARNDALHLLNKDRTFEEIRSKSPVIHQELVEVLSGLSEEDLIAPNYLLDPPQFDDWTIAGTIPEMSWQHYAMHAPDIEALLEKSRKS